MLDASKIIFLFFITLTKGKIMLNNKYTIPANICFDNWINDYSPMFINKQKDGTFSVFYKIWFHKSENGLRFFDFVCPNVDKLIEDIQKPIVWSNQQPVHVHYIDERIIKNIRNWASKPFVYESRLFFKQPCDEQGVLNNIQNSFGESIIITRDEDGRIFITTYDEEVSKKLNRIEYSENGTTIYFIQKKY